MPSIFFFSARAQAAAGVFSNEKHAQLRTMNRNESARRFSWPRGAPSGRQMMSNKQGCTHSLTGRPQQLFSKPPIMLIFIYKPVRSGLASGNNARIIIRRRGEHFSFHWSAGEGCLRGLDTCFYDKMRKLTNLNVYAERRAWEITSGNVAPIGIFCVWLTHLFVCFTKLPFVPLFLLLLLMI